MPDNLTYRTDDLTRWGTGQGSDLNADQIDINFFTLWAAIQALEDHAQNVAQIASMHAVGDQFYVTLTDASVIGPITLPTSQWHFRSDGWVANTAYNAFDVFNRNGATYLVNIAHTSQPTFSPNATDGLGHNYYSLLLENAQNMLPADGIAGQRLIRSTGSPFATEWVYDRVRLAPFIAGIPLANELVMQFNVADNMVFPAGLVGSVAYAHTPTATNVSWTLSKNGSAIGSIDFSTSPSEVNVSFPADIDCIPGDVITLNAPAIPDAQQADISFTLVALLDI